MVDCRLGAPTPQQLRPQGFLQSRGFPKIRVKGTFLGGPYKKDYSILGSIFGSPYLGKLPVGLAICSLVMGCKVRFWGFGNEKENGNK